MNTKNEEASHPYCGTRCGTRVLPCGDAPFLAAFLARPPCNVTYESVYLTRAANPNVGESPGSG